MVRHLCTIYFFTNKKHIEFSYFSRVMVRVMVKG